MNQTVYALFRNHDDAHYALQDLLSNGFSRDSISLAVYRQEVKSDAENGGTLASGGALTGLVAGTVLGGVIGAILGVFSYFILSHGLLYIGGWGWVIAGMISGGVTGLTLGAVIGFGIPKEKADFYAEGVDDGGTLVLVGVNDGNFELAEALLDRDGAVDVGSRSMEYHKGEIHHFEESGRIYDEEGDVLATRSSLL